MEIRKFDTGAVRDADADTTRYDLVSPEGIRRLAETYAEGAQKYDDHNWRKGMPFSATANHAIKHVFQYLAGQTDEDHLAHAAWGLFALMEFEKTHPELDDRFFKPSKWRPIYKKNLGWSCEDEGCTSPDHFAKEALTVD